MQTSFGQWLKETIKSKGITQAELAQLIGVQPPQISHIISGERGTTPENIRAIARVLKLPPEEVFRIAGLLPPVTGELSPKKKELVYLAEQADEDAVDMAIAVLEAAVRNKNRK